jgi:hypothetical protein
MLLKAVTSQYVKIKEQKLEKRVGLLGDFLEEIK